MKYEKKHVGNIIFNINADYSALQEVTGYIYSSGGDIKEGAFPQDLKTQDPKNTASVDSKKYLFEVFLSQGFIFADSILSKLISKKTVRNTTVYTVKHIAKDKESYIVQTGDLFSHGETIKQAKESLIYKISNRDTSKYKSLKLTSKISFEKAIKMYRVITGACEFGCKSFVSRLKETKKEYTVQEVINLTSGNYGNEQLRSFFGVR